MSAILCPMLTALKPVDDAGQPVNRECIYEQCRFFDLEKRDCTLMMASRAMLRMSAEAAARPAESAAKAPTGPDLEHALLEMKKDLLGSFLELQGLVTQSGQATLDKAGRVEAAAGTLETRTASIEAKAAAIEGRIASLEARLASAGDAHDARFKEMADRLATLLRERLDETARGVNEAHANRLAGVEQAVGRWLEKVREQTERQFADTTSRLESQAGALAEAVGGSAQIGSQVAHLTELQQKVAERLLEELSLVSANARKLVQAVEAAEKRVDRAAQETLNVSQLLTLIKGETERTYAALRSINEGNRLVVQAIEAQIQRDRAEVQVKRREEAQVCNNRGVLAYYRGALDAAVEAFRQAVKLQPEHAEAHNNLGLVLSKLGREKEAVAAFQEALRLDPRMGEAYNNLGFLYHTSSQFDRAAEMFGQAIQNAADSAVAYTNLGNTFYKMKQSERAVEAWRRALDLDPMNENARRGLRMFQQDPGHN